MKVMKITFSHYSSNKEKQKINLRNCLQNYFNSFLLSSKLNLLIIIYIKKKKTKK